MFKQVVEAARQMIFLLRDVEENKKDISSLKEDVATLKEQLAETNQLVRQLAFEIQRSNENERQEREKFILRVENILLRERQFPRPAVQKNGNNSQCPKRSIPSNFCASTLAAVLMTASPR